MSTTKKASDRAYYQKNRERILERSKLHRKPNTWHTRNREKSLAYHRAYNASHREELKAKREARAGILKVLRMKRRYGLTPEQFDKILASQGSRCAICKTSDFGGKYPCVDHCHNGGHVRGILCQPCNSMIGFARHSVTILSGAVKYLSKEALFNQHE